MAAVLNTWELFDEHLWLINVFLQFMIMCMCIYIYLISYICIYVRVAFWNLCVYIYIHIHMIGFTCVYLNNPMCPFQPSFDSSVGQLIVRPGPTSHLGMLMETGDQPKKICRRLYAPFCLPNQSPSAEAWPWWRSWMAGLILFVSNPKEDNKRSEE